LCPEGWSDGLNQISNPVYVTGAWWVDFIYLELWTLHEVARVLSHLWKLKDQLEQMLDVLSMCGWGWNGV